MPKFNRISLVGSEELFRPTRVEHDDDSPVEEAPAPAPVCAAREGKPVTTRVCDGRPRVILVIDPVAP